jgi:hypothetical protein
MEQKFKPTKFPVAEQAEVPYTNIVDTVSTVSITSLMDARVLITGTVTGKQYVFSKAGTVVEVDKLDADEILNKKRGRVCCGKAGNLFQLT